MATKLGEVQAEMTDDVTKTDDLKVLLGIGWGAESTQVISFKPSEDLKKGDKVKITIEKL
jgi:hypothetical protein